MLGEPHCRAQFGTQTVVGDGGEIQVPTLAGPWSGFEWRLDPDKPGALVAIADAHAARAREVLARLKRVGRANTEGGTSSIRPPSVEAYDEERGLWGNTGGDGLYDVRAVYDGGVAVCIVAGDLDLLEEAVLRGEDPSATALAVLEAYAPADDEDDDAWQREATAELAVDVLCRAPVSERGLTVLRALVDAPDGVGMVATTKLARLAPDPAPHFARLLAGLDTGDGNWFWKIAEVLRLSTRLDFGELALARVATGGLPWPAYRLDLLRALLAGNHPRALPELRAIAASGSPWHRARAAVILLSHDPSDCAAAEILVAHTGRYDTHDFAGDPPQFGYGSDWDNVLAAMTGHACPTCAPSWAAAVARSKTLDIPSLRRLHFILGAR